MDDSLDFTATATATAPAPARAPAAPPPPPNSPLSRLQARLETLDLTGLPRVSPVASKLAALNPADLDSTREFCQLIEQEPICVARLIGLANSVAFGVPGKKFNSLDAAVARIGLERSGQIAFGMLCGQALNKGLSKAWCEFLWMHAMAVAHGASLIANKVAPQERANAYLAGMIYDIGTLVIECLQPGTLDVLLETAETRELKLGEVENVMLGKARRAVSTALLEKWSLPDEIIVAVAERDPEALEPDSLPAILAVADDLARTSAVLGAVYADVESPLPLGSVMLEEISPRRAGLVSLDEDALMTLAERLSGQVLAMRATAQTFAQTS